MPGPPPKKNAARRNKSSTKATLSAAPGVEVPKLPTGTWHPMTREWWKDIWASPMASEFLDADQHALFRLAVMVNDYWEAESASARKELAGEIRLQSQAFGLTPIDRRRLQWEVEKIDGGEKKPPKRRKRGKDPRSHLSAVK